VCTVTALKAQAVKVYLVPAVFTTNSFGISLLKATIALNPVQWVPTIIVRFHGLDIGYGALNKLRLRNNKLPST